MPGILCGEAESRKGIRYDVTCGRQILARRGRQIHDPLDTAEHVFRLPTGHGHIIHGFCGLGSGELRLLAHLTCFVPQGFQIGTSRAGNGGNLAHAGIEISRSLHRRDTRCRDNARNRKHFCPGSGDLVSDILHLLSCSLQFLSRDGAEVLIFFRQTFQLLFGIRDFPGQRFLLTDCIISLRSVFQLLEG